MEVIISSTKNKVGFTFYDNSKRIEFYETKNPNRILAMSLPDEEKSKGDNLYYKPLRIDRYQYAVYVLLDNPGLINVMIYNKNGKKLLGGEMYPIIFE